MNELTLDRESLLIYLNNLCITETIIHQSKKSRSTLSKELYTKENEIKDCQNTLNRFKNQTPSVAASSFNVIGTIIAGCFVFAVIGCVIGVFDGFEHDFEFISRGGRGLRNGAIIGLIVSAIYSIIKKSKENEAYTERLQNANDEWSRNISETQDRYTKLSEDYNNKKPLIDNEIAHLDSIIAHMEKIRDDMYGMNIIPYTASSDANLRTLEGVQYLYEFMSNSRESFVTAVYNFKLDSIISRLDTLIANTEHIISNQDKLMSQQDQMLRKIQDQERKMEMTKETLENIEDYSKMIAQNSELQTSMEKEALYYQRVRYYKDL